MAFGSDLRRIACLTAWLLAVPAGSGFALEHSITQLVVSIGAGRIVAVRWREAVEAMGSFLPLDLVDGRSLS